MNSKAQQKIIKRVCLMIFLKRVMEKYDLIMETILPTLRQERRKKLIVFFTDLP